MQPTNESALTSSLNPEQREEVLTQLESLLASPLFRQSKRYPAFLRYVVESTLKGSEEELKERTIGMEVFGRLPHYDTSMDPTVRLTAAEVRKRLAQYYQQSEHKAELQIALNPGSYIPIFSWPAVASPAHEEASPSPASTDEPPSQPASRSFLRWAIPVTVAILGVVAAGLAVSRHAVATENTRSLWSPLLRDANASRLVLPDLSKTELTPQTPETASTSVISHIRYNRLVDFNDSVAVAHLAGVLGARNKPYSVLLSSDATFEDLQSGPSILIGAVDNPWTMRFLQPLPFSVVRRGETMTFEIAGKDRTVQHDWSLDLNQPFGKLQQDYGIVVRQTDSMTGHAVLIVAGLGQNGTAAGIRLLTDPELERQVMEAAPKGWSGRNLEVVFRTQIIDDKFGPPVIVAHEYW